ncbi:uncharacterized protein LOC119736362 isoform X2 [Patiria miniata]|uniref:C2H2-type domain-containing protein n=1 Tax=Patiria miniata TaxID=46514 RepID=A0A914ASG5_PATMI|nr:uncharacterized protein LOC119736362 isoform X2 [Patiria miniata]
MDGGGNSWPVDGTLPQFSAPVAEGLSQALTFQSGESSPYLSDSKNEGEALDLFKQPPESLASSYTELSDFFKLPWEGNEQASSDPLGGLPSLLNVENLGNVSSEEISATCLENNNRKEPGNCGDESSWSGDILLSQSAHDSRSFDNPNEAIPGQDESNLADKLLFSTPPFVESNKACIAQNTRVTPVNPFSQLALYAKKSTGENTQNSSPACIPSQENSYAASSVGGNPTETEQSIPMQSDPLSSLHQASSNVSVPTPELRHSSGYATCAGQTDQDFISMESNLSDEGVGETKEIRIDDTFSLQCDPPSFSDDDSDIKSPELCADLTRISSIAEQWCSDPSSSQDDGQMPGMTDFEYRSPLSSVSHKQSFQDIVVSPRQQKQGPETQNKDSTSSLSTDLEPTPIPQSNLEAVTDNSMMQLDTNNEDENSQECRQERLQLEEEENTPFAQNSNSSVSMKMLDVHQTQEVSENSSSEVQQESALNPKKIDSHFADNTLIEFNTNKHCDEGIQGILKEAAQDVPLEAEQDVPLDQASGSDVLSSKHSKDNGNLWSDDGGSSASEESVILLSDIEFDAEDKGKGVAPIMVKIENPPTPDRTCQNEASEGTEPDSTTNNSDDKCETEPGGSLLVDDLQNTDSPSDVRLKSGATLDDDRFNAALSQDTSGVLANESVSCEANENSPCTDSSDVREETMTSSAKDQKHSPNISMAKADCILTERGTAKNKSELERNKDGISASSKDKLSKVKCQADVIEISDDLSDSECQECTDVSKNQDEHSEQDTTEDVARSNQGGDVSREADTPIALSDSEETSFSQNMVNKTADANPAVVDGSNNDTDKCPISSEDIPTKNSTSQTPEKESHQEENEEDDDVIIIDEDPEVISLGSSDEDEAGDNSVSELQKVTAESNYTRTTRSASKRNPVSRAASATTVKKTEWACHICSERSRSLNSLKLHVRRVHNLIMIHRKEDMKCKLCSFTGTWQKIKEHIINDHETPLKWYIKNHETREIIKLPSSSSVPPESPKTPEKTVTSARSSQPGEACKQKTTPVSKQHYLIKRVANIDVDKQGQSTPSMMTRRKQTSLRSPTVTSSSVNTSIRSPTVTSSSVNTSIRSPTVTASSVITPIRHVTVTSSVNTPIQRLTVTSSVNTSVRSLVKTSSVTCTSQSLNSSSVKTFSVNATRTISSTSTSTTNAVMRSVIPPAVNKPVPGSASTQSNPSSQNNFIIIRHQKPITTTGLGVTNSSPSSSQRFYPVFPGAIQSTAATTVRQKLVYANTIRAAAQKSVQNSILRHPVTPSTVGVSHLPYPQRVGPSTKLSQSIPKLGPSQPASQKTILRVVSNSTGQGSASNAQVDMSAARALLNAICKSSMANASTKVAPLSKANFAVSALPNTLSKSVVSSPLVNPTNTRKMYIPSTSTIIRTSISSPSLGVYGNQSFVPLTTTCKAQTVTTQSSGPVTSTDVASKITVQRTFSEGETMASYVIRVPKARSDGNIYSVLSDEKKDDDYFYLVKVPINKTNAPKKFMVHLPVDKDSTVKHAVCIVQPPAGGSDGMKQGSSTGLTKSGASHSSQGKLQSPFDNVKTSLGQIKSIAPGHDRPKADGNVQQVVPLKITKTREDPAKKAECLAHLQEPPVSIHLLESQFKDTKVFQAADLIKVDDRVQYECARCKEAFPQLMLLRLHHIDCTVHPPSNKVLPIVHIPTALLAAFFTLSASGYSSACAVCRVLLLGNARNVEDQQDFCSHLAKHAEPQVAITSLDDTRKLGILQTRMTSQQAKEWVDYLVPPFKMWNKPTSTYDGSLEEHICTTGILHRESVIRKGKRKRSPSPQRRKNEKNKKHKKHKKHKRHKSPDIEVVDRRSNQGARSKYRSTLKTAEGCEGEWVEPSPKDSGELWTRKKSHPGRLKESIMRSPSHPKLLQHGMKVNFNKTSKNSPSKASQRFMSVKVPGRRSLRGMGLDFGQGLMMLPMTRKKKKTVNKPASTVSTGDLEEGHKTNSKTDAVHNTKDLDDIVIISSDDDEDDSETKDDDIQSDDKEDSNRAPDDGMVDAGEESDSKDALSDNLDDSSSDDEDADEQQSDMDGVADEIDEDKDESNRRDIPLTMMALHYRRLNETMAKNKDSDSEDETGMEESPSRVLSHSDNEQEDKETKTSEDRDEEMTTETHQKYRTSPDDKLQEVCSSPQLRVESPLPVRDAGNSSEGSSQGSDPKHPHINNESSNKESESLEHDTPLHDKKAQHNTWKPYTPSEIQPEESTKSKPKAKDGESQLSETCKDVDSEPQANALISSEAEVVDNLPQDNVSESRHQETCLLDFEDNSHSSKADDTTSDARNLDNAEDWNLEDLSDIDEMSVEGSFGSENSNQGNIFSDSPDNIISETRNYEDGQSKDTLSVAGILEKQTKEGSLLEGDKGENDILGNTQEDEKSNQDKITPDAPDNRISETTCFKDSHSGIVEEQMSEDILLANDEETNEIMDNTQEDRPRGPDACGSETSKDAKSSMKDDVEILSVNAKEDSVLEDDEDDILDYIPEDSLLDHDTHKDETPQDTQSSRQDEAVILEAQMNDGSLLEDDEGDDILDYIPDDSLLDFDTHKVETPKDTQSSRQDQAVILEAQTKEDSLLEDDEGDDILDYIPEGSLLDSDTNEDETPKDTQSSMQDQAVTLEAQTKEDSLLEDDEGDDILDYIPDDSLLDFDTHKVETPKDTQSSRQDQAVILEAQTNEGSLLEDDEGDDILDYIPEGSLLDSDTNEDETPKDTQSSMQDNAVILEAQTNKDSLLEDDEGDDILDYIPEDGPPSPDTCEDETPKDTQSGMQDEAVILEAQTKEGSILEDDEGDDILTQEDGLPSPDTCDEEAPKGTQSNIQDDHRDIFTDDSAQLDVDLATDLQDNNTSGDSSADETWKRKSRKEKTSEDDIVQDSFEEYENLESVPETDMLREDVPGNRNLDDLGENILSEEMTEDLKQHEKSGEESDQRHSFSANKTPWDNCSVDSVTERSTQWDRFSQEKNLTEQNISDGSQTDETLGQSLCTSEDESDVNETSRRDRFFSERSLEDSLGSHRIDAVPGGAVGDETASSVSFSGEDGVEDVFQNEDSGGVFGQDSDDGVKEERQDTGSCRDGDDDDEYSDDVICLLSDSDDEDVPSLSSDPQPTMHSLKYHPSLAASESRPSKTPTNQARKLNLKRKSSHEHEEDESEDDAYRLKRSRGDEDCASVAHSDSWCLLEESEDSEGPSDPDTVWKREVGSSVFTHEDIAQLRAGGL